MRKYLALLSVALVLLLTGTALAETNLLENPRFEALGQDGLPLGWDTGAYLTAEGYTAFSTAEDGLEGSCAVITNFGDNDARFTQAVTVEPDSVYRLSGYVRASEVEDYGWGANLSVEGVYLTVESFFDTGDEWVYTELYGRTGPDQTEIVVYARLGGYGGESMGTAAFDDLCLEKVDSLPEGALCEPWYYDSSAWSSTEEQEEEEDSTASPFWPWLLVLSALWLIGGAYIVLQLLPKRADLRQKGRMPLFAVVGLVLAFLLRYVIAVLVDGYQVDVNCFVAWGYTMADYGPTAFYSSTSFCDYPPGYMLVLGLNELLARGLTALFGGALPNLLRRSVLIKLLPMACDIGMALLAYRASEKRGSSREQAGLLSLLVAFCPALICNSAAWCQVDAVLCLLLALVVWFALEHRWQLALPVYMLAVLVKPQALMAGPVGLLALVMEFMPGLRRRDDFEKPAALFGKPACLKQILIGLGAALAVALAVLLPFVIGMGGVSWLIQKYSDTLASYPYATVNTANLYYLFGGNWSALTSRAHIGVKLLLALIAGGWGLWHGLGLRKHRAAAWWLEPALMGCFAAFYLGACFTDCSWTVIGYTAMGLAFAVVMPLLLRSRRLDFLPLAGGLLFLLLYVLGTKMHERYLFPALILLALAFAIHRDWRLPAVLLLVSCTLFVNEGIVLDNSVRLGSSMGHLNDDTRWLNMLLSALNVCAVPLLLWTAGDIALDGDAVPAEASPLTRLLPEKALAPGKQKDPLDFRPDAGLHWKRIDTVLVLTVTLLYSALALWNLGSTKAPQTFWTSTSASEQVVLDLGQHYDDVAVAYYCGVSYDNFSVAVSDDGETWSEEYWAEMNEGSCYQWKYLVPTYNSSEGVSFTWVNHLSDVRRVSGRYVRVSANQIGLKLGEIIFRDADGNGIAATVVSRSGERTDSPLLSDPSLCVDEPDSLEGEPGWYNSTYFDEIYHARTGKELLDGTSPYEWTHPPLGKVIMSFFISIFGMTPFGWRFGGALMGILMLPFMYLLGKQLTKKTLPAFAAMSLMALDCMHLTQTRIATIDSFPVFFIIAAYLFMLRFMQRDIARQPMKKLLPDLGLCGLMISLGIASKWIALYAGAGLAVLYFWTLARHLRLSRLAQARLREDNAAGKRGDAERLTPEQRSELKQRTEGLWRRLLALCLWCCLFFIVLPVTVYLLSYIPALAYQKADSLGEFISLVIREQQNMYNYHSTPGLGMDHAFYSPWYEWPLIVRPMYYAMAYFQPEGCSMSIFCFGNPLVWLVGLVGLAATLCFWLRKHVYRLEGRDSLLHAESHDWDVGPAFILIGLLAQLLPWILVPRGTYIYHYFASIPFLVLAITLLLHRCCLRFPKSGKVVVIVYLVLTALSFLLFYPYASGITAPTWWLDLGKRFLNLYYSL